MPYAPVPVKAPRLTGFPLRAFAALVQTPGIGALIRAQLLTQVGIPKLRAADVGDASPLRPPWLTEAGPPTEGEPVSVSPVPGFSPPSIEDYRAAYRSGASDPVRVARAFLDAVKRLDAGDRPLRAILAVNEADLLAQAEASAKRWREGRPLPLDGVPIAVKDEIDQVPFPTTVGTSFLGKSPATEDATVVARLRAAGALLVGKANMHELGIGVTGINPHHGAARNPYDPGHVTGGSSSGSAAAVAAGLCPVAIGADGGGSIRLPAALCGVVGLKSTWGRVSEHGAAPLCWNVAHVGPIAAHAHDLAEVHAIIAGPDPRDSGSLGQPLLGPPSLPTHLRVGVMRAWFEHADAAQVERSRALLAALGAEIVEIDLPDPDLVRVAHLVTIVGEMAASQLPYAAPTYGPDTALNFALAKGLSAADYVQGARVRAHLAEGWRRAFAEVDLVATPAAACTAPPIRPDALGGESDIETLDRVMRFAHAPNLFGFPAITVPSGYDAAGLPTSLQLIARPWAEDLLLGVAIRAGGLVERRKPQVWAELLG